MKVACFFGGRTNLGGAERRIGRIMNLIAKKGVEVTFVFYLYEDMYAIEAEYKSLIGDIVYLDMVGFKKQSELFRYVMNSRFDTIFYIGAYRSMLPFFVAGILSHSQRVLLQVSTGPSVRKFESFVEMIGFEVVARGSNRIDCLYPSTTESFAKRYKIQTITTTPCPSTQLNIYMPNSKKKELVFLSRWVQGKNVDLFAKSMMLIEDFLVEKGYKIFLCGSSRNGDVEKQIKKILEKSKHPELFSMTGYVQSIDVLPTAEVFFSLQDINNYPSQSLLEAIACGCYIIASDEGDTRTLVRDEFGVCCDLDAQKIAQKTKDYILMNEKEKKQVVESARNFAERNFDINKSVEHYMTIIQNPVM